MKSFIRCPGRPTGGRAFILESRAGTVTDWTFFRGLTIVAAKERVFAFHPACETRIHIVISNLKLINPPLHDNSRSFVFDAMRREFPHHQPREIANAIATARKFMRPHEGPEQLVYLARGALSGAAGSQE